MKNMNLFAPANQKEKEEIIKDLTKDTLAFGIDLGTTNSAIACVPYGVESQIMQLDSGKTTMPSCIMWEGIEGEFIVGDVAYKHRFQDNAVYSIKRLMEDPEATVTLTYEDKELVMTPAEVSAEILKGLVKKTKNTYGEIKDVIVTVPNAFNMNGKKATAEACRLAGLNLLGILIEPTAASLCYNIDSAQKDILVYDLGGGTFDVSLVRISQESTDTASKLSDIFGFDTEENKASSKSINVLAGAGDPHLGGDDVDQELYKIVLNKLAEQGKDIASISEEDQKKLILKLERLKKAGKDTICEMKCIFNENTEKEEIIPVILTEIDFINALLPIYRRTEKIVHSVLQETNSDADTIVLVGGATKDPHVKELLERSFPSFQIDNAYSPDESVAIGAGIQAKTVKFGTSDVKVFDSLALTIGIRTEDSVMPVIMKNSPFPVSKSKIFTNVVDNQYSVDIEVMQGNSLKAYACTSLGVLTIDDLPPAPADTLKIVVQLFINATGLLKCHATISNPDDLNAGIIQRDLELNLVSALDTTSTKLTKEERMIAKWRKKAKEFGGEDEILLNSMIDKYPTEVSKDEIITFITSRIND